MSGESSPRLFAAAAALTGAAFLMVRSEPSWTGVLVGLSCLALWGLGTLAAKPGRPRTLTKLSRPVVLEAVVVETTRAKPELLLPAPPRPVRQAIAARPTQLPAVPSHRQRVVERHVRGRR
ncbi:energy transducer TonB [Methylobacterium sp. J-048]|uniref:energy transducer TonB n=1 Tax=Methylobacterium sp. J-048 TaxID=2836635 RepID=UPI001FB8E456|nr:energy transducer TonB [Methylobacterium sp. J-048]MCJ2057286.1 energy transducer TonB [Methylobacterium sp. J-048]